MKKLLIILTIGLSVISCKKELDHPPVTELNDNDIIALDTLISMYQGQDIKFDSNYYVYATVTMDEVDGNIYKQVFVQQGEKAINVRVLQSGFLFVGDSIRINLNGTTLSKYAGVMQLDSVDFAKNIAVQTSGKYIQPKSVTIADLDTAFLNVLATEPSNPNVQYKYLSELVVLENVQFSAADTASTYADAIGQTAQNIMLEDCDGNSIIVRTSGYANFAGELVAKGNGRLVAIVSRYDSDLQLLIRSFDEIDMTGDRCFGQLVFDFEDNTLQGWQSVSVSGTIPWVSSFFSNNNFAKITNWDGVANSACETWLVSPEIDFSSSANPSMQFINDVNYSGPVLQLLISTDYTGVGNPSQVGTWTDISSLVTWDPDTGAWGFNDSGVIDLTIYAAYQKIYVAFKYTGTATSGSTWEIDDIKFNG
jgi:hypothetical protein